MGSLVIFITVVVVMALIIVGWAMALKIQRERKISELKITYIRLAGEEQNSYQRYIQAEKALQDVELELERSKEIVTGLKVKIRQRRKELRELIEHLRLVKSKLNILSGSSTKLDLELDNTKLTGEIRTRLLLNNEDKVRLLMEMAKIQEKKIDLPFLSKESAELGNTWERMRQELEQVEADFRALDAHAWKKFADSYVKNRSEESKLDPERELVNMILLLNNKKGLLYVRKKEMAKEPTTESAKLVKKYETDIKKLESQLIQKSRSLGVSMKRLTELKNLFLK